MNPSMDAACQLALTANFGSVERWRDAFVALGKSQAGRPGSVLLVFDPQRGTLVNQVVPDPSQVLAGGVSLLALDLQAPTQHPDEAAAAGDPVDRFVGLIDWPAVYQRYQQAVHDASAPFGADQDAASGALLLDVRRAGVFANATHMIPGARWHDPAAVATWAAGLPTDREVVVYCVHGHEVSRATALRLRATGVKARYLQGGIQGWQAAGPPRAGKGTGS